MALDPDHLNQATPRFAKGGVIKLEGDKVPVLLEPGVCILTGKAAEALLDCVHLEFEGRDLVALETGGTAHRKP